MVHMGGITVTAIKHAKKEPPTTSQRIISKVVILAIRVTGPDESENYKCHYKSYTHQTRNDKLREAQTRPIK